VFLFIYNVVIASVVIIRIRYNGDYWNEKEDNRMTVELSHLNKYFKVYKDKPMVTYCPICFNTICLTRNIEGKWIERCGCCHLRAMVVEDGNYIGRFSYELGAFEGIK
jgi:hypothetical protein